MKIYAAYKLHGYIWLYELKKGYNVHYWHSLGAGGPHSKKSLSELDGPIFSIKRDGGMVRDEDMEELCEFSPP